MSLMGGLVDTSSEHVAETPRSVPVSAHVKEWMIRNAWGLVLGTGVLFWVAVAGVLLAR